MFCLVFERSSAETFTHDTNHYTHSMHIAESLSFRFCYVGFCSNTGQLINRCNEFVSGVGSQRFKSRLMGVVKSLPSMQQFLRKEL